MSVSQARVEDFGAGRCSGKVPVNPTEYQEICVLYTCHHEVPGPAIKLQLELTQKVTRGRDPPSGVRSDNPD